MMKVKLSREQILLVIIEAAVKKFEIINQKLQEQLYRYSVTNLFNRKYLLEKGNQYLKEGKYNTLAVIDIRNLRTYNEIFGYETTDRILKALAQKIREYCEKGCLVGNLDSGRFWILTHIEGKKREEIVKEKAKGLIKFLAEDELKIKIGSEDLLILVSLNVGIAFYPEHGRDIGELLMSAEMATDRAKDKGINTFTLFQEDFKKNVEENIWIEEQLRKSIKTGRIEEQIYPVFQVRVNPRLGKVTGVEVLMRWKLHPRIFKVVLVAEKTGLIKELFNVLVKKTVPVIKSALSIYPSLSFGFNISPAQLGSVEELRKTLDHLIKEGIEPQKVQLEITETQILENKQVEETLIEFAKKGFKLVIDDFGRGYSSFDRLKTWEIYGVKIDRSLIVDIPQKVKQFGDQVREFKFLKNLVGFLKNMGYAVTVEGVETPEMVELAKQLEVDEVQGFYYSKPVDEETFIKCLKEWSKMGKCPFSGN
ncbi:MAG: hypothetical protein DSZ31_02325 [Gammaproteobacteria bacterium]|nr:MAG: hypothetical protein DSZ31_02325 [Gammaproteobacteria bacterium]